MDFDRILIFTDGACSGNPGRGGWGAVIVTPKGQVQELGGGSRETTNNRMELLATIKAVEWCGQQPEGIALYTDSVYVIRGITQWIWGWRKKGWKNSQGEDVANKDLWQMLAGAVAARPSSGKIDWRFVKGHAGVPGNERVDQIAVDFTKGKRPELYEGTLLKYDVPIHDLPKEHGLPEPRKSDSGKKKKAYSYLSYVDGRLSRHSTWAQCEAAVKGRSGARFKKATSAEDEKSIVRQWGLDPSELP